MSSPDEELEPPLVTISTTCMEEDTENSDAAGFTQPVVYADAPAYIVGSSMFKYETCSETIPEERPVRERFDAQSLPVAVAKSFHRPSPRTTVIVSSVVMFLCLLLCFILLPFLAREDAELATALFTPAAIGFGVSMNVLCCSCFLFESDDLLIASGDIEMTVHDGDTEMTEYDIA